MTDQERNEMWVRLYEDYGTNLYKYLLRLSGDPMWADDLMQHALINFVLQYPPGFLPFEKENSTLHTIGTRIFIDQYRRGSLSKNVQYEEKPLDDLDLAYTETPEMAMMNIETISSIEVAIEMLPEEYQVTARLHLLEYTNDEIAQALNIPIGTVQSRVFRARKRLATILGTEI